MGQESRPEHGRSVMFSVPPGLSAAPRAPQTLTAATVAPETSLGTGRDLLGALGLRGRQGNIYEHFQPEAGSYVPPPRLLAAMRPRSESTDNASCSGLPPILPDTSRELKQHASPWGYSPPLAVPTTRPGANQSAQALVSPASSLGALAPRPQASSISDGAHGRSQTRSSSAPGTAPANKASRVGMLQHLRNMHQGGVS